IETVLSSRLCGTNQTGGADIMMQLGMFRSCLRLAWPFAMAVLATPPALAAAQETILFTFKGHDGQYPSTDLTRDSAGNLYGTTNSVARDGGGLVFSLTKKPNGKY